MFAKISKKLDNMLKRGSNKSGVATVLIFTCLYLTGIFFAMYIFIGGVKFIPFDLQHLLINPICDLNWYISLFLISTLCYFFVRLATAEIEVREEMDENERRLSSASARKKLAVDVKSTNFVRLKKRYLVEIMRVGNVGFGSYSAFCVSYYSLYEASMQCT